MIIHENLLLKNHVLLVIFEKAAKFEFVIVGGALRFNIFLDFQENGAPPGHPQGFWGSGENGYLFSGI